MSLKRLNRKLDLLVEREGRVDEAEQLRGVQCLQQHASDLAGKLRLSGTNKQIQTLSEHLLLLFRGSLRQHGSEIDVGWSRDSSSGRGSRGNVDDISLEHIGDGTKCCCGGEAACHDARNRAPLQATAAFAVNLTRQANGKGGKRAAAAQQPKSLLAAVAPRLQRCLFKQTRRQLE